MAMATPRGFGSILVPLDGHSLAEQALPVARHLARQAGATLHLVTVQPPMSPLVLTSEVAAAAQELEEETSKDLAAYLDRIAGELRAAGVTVTTALLHGPPADRIDAYVLDRWIELVVMTTHGRGGLSRLWLGSVADHLLRTLEVPILLLRAHEGPQPTEYHRILAVIGERAELEVVEPALTLGAVTGTTSYVLAHVVEPPPPVLAPVPVSAPGLEADLLETWQHGCLRYLTPLADRLTARGLSVETKVVVGTPVAAEILELARSVHADLIAMGTHGRRGLQRLVLGSVADKIVRASDVPVLVTPVLAD
jgi:nucleotide-binding universal stress UspA family protein